MALEPMPLISVVIPTRNRKNIVIRCIKSVFDSDYSNLEIVVIDDASDDGTYEDLKQLFPQVNVIRNSKRRLMTFCRNVGVLRSHGDLIFFLDDDNIVDRNTITQLARYCTKYDNVSVTAPLAYHSCEPSKVWFSIVKYAPQGIMLHLKNDIPKYPTIIEVFHNAFMVKKKIFKEVGLFNDVDFPIHLSEVEFYLRLKKKSYLALLVPSAKVWHDVPIRKGGWLRHYDSFRARFLVRNYVLLSAYFGSAHFLAFVICIAPAISIRYVVLALINKRINVVHSLISGFLEGIKLGARKL